MLARKTKGWIRGQSAVKNGGDQKQKNLLFKWDKGFLHAAEREEVKIKEVFSCEGTCLTNFLNSLKGRGLFKVGIFFCLCFNEAYVDELDKVSGSW